MNANMPEGAGGGEIFRLATSIVKKALAKNVRICAAESLTGGLVAAAIVQVPGASQVFNGGIIAYDLFLKESLLGVSKALLEREGAVNEEVAKQMAAGVREACLVPSVGSKDQVVGIATTGVAGPDPDPVTGQGAGTVWVAVSSHLGEQAVLLNLKGARDEVREKSVEEALYLLKSELESL